MKSIPITLSPDSPLTIKKGIIHTQIMMPPEPDMGWIERLRSRDVTLTRDAVRLIGSDQFAGGRRPSAVGRRRPKLLIRTCAKMVPVKKSGKRTELAILPVEHFLERFRTLEQVRTIAKKSGFILPTPNVACQILAQIPDDCLEEIGISWLIVMHEPILEMQFDISNSSGGLILDAIAPEPKYKFEVGGGFVFMKA